MKDNYAIFADQVEELAAQGIDDKFIASTCNLSLGQFKKQLKNCSILRGAFNRGKLASSTQYLNTLTSLLCSDSDKIKAQVARYLLDRVDRSAALQEDNEQENFDNFNFNVNITKKDKK